MSTPASGRRRRRLVGVLVTLAAALGLFLSLSGTASAAVTCSFDDTTNFVNVVINDSVAPFNNTVTLKRSGQLITVNGAPCFDGFGVQATVVNADQINVTPAPAGADGDDTLVVDLSAGPFSPGFLPEIGPGSLNEIEIFGYLGIGANTVQVIGSNAAEGITGGQDGTLVDNWDGLPVTAANGDVFTVPEYGDLLLNLNSGLLTDDDADLWVVNGNTGCVAEECFIWALDLQLGLGDGLRVDEQQALDLRVALVEQHPEEAAPVGGPGRIPGRDQGVLQHPLVAPVGIGHDEPRCVVDLVDDAVEGDAIAVR